MFYFAKILIMIIKSNSKVFQLSGLKFKLTTSENKECDNLDRLRLSQKDQKSYVIILYKYYLSKFSEIEDQLLKWRFEILLIIHQFVAKSSRVIW